MRLSETWGGNTYDNSPVTILPDGRMGFPSGPIGALMLRV